MQTMKMIEKVTTGALVLATVLAASSGMALADRRGGGDGMGLGGFGAVGTFDFATLDADKDGKVTEAEILAHRTARITAADTDGDGKISAAELAAMVEGEMQMRAERRAAQMITRLDTDKDGALSPEELLAAQAGGRMFGRLDSDNDGALSEAELDAAQARMAERMDGDESGRKKHRGGWFGGRGNN
jgi:Ca2+-binding EF-hand superfamily protein